jgi:hypothetical protein
MPTKQGESDPAQPTDEKITPHPLKRKTLEGVMLGVPDWGLVPEHMRSALRMFVEHGIEPGGFMRAVLENNLSWAFARADAINRTRIGDIVNFMNWHAPAACWGSPERVANWIAAGGLNGHDQEDNRPNPARSADEIEDDYD